jgi:ribonucleotide reductase alpha subunit
MKERKTYTYNEALEKSIEYFNGNELSAKVYLDKYALRDDNDNILEDTPEKMHWRLAYEFARIESKKFKTPYTAEFVYNLFKRFEKIIPQGSPLYGIGNNYQITSLSNCFVVPSTKDSYGGIFYTDEQFAQISKRRGGVGGDISELRPEGVRTNNAAKSSTGQVGFGKRFSNTLREVAQKGRRGAGMITDNIHHPECVVLWDKETDGEPYDVEVKTDEYNFTVSSEYFNPNKIDFITCKYDPTKVTGANISVKVTDEFLNALNKKEDFQQRWPIKSKNPTITKMVSAEKVWDKLIHSAWRTGEPGILFWDNIIRESIPDCYSSFGFETISTNPCIIGSTLIAVADGRNAVSIEQLTLEGKDIPIYSVDRRTGRTVIKMGRNPRKTGIKKEVWKLTLDDGSILIATPDHNILKLNMEYCELKNLKKGDSISPFYSFDSNGYRQISNTGSKMIGGAIRNRRQYRLIYEFYKGVINSKTHAIYHKDFNKFNDAIENLISMELSDHKNLHSEEMKGLKNPYHRMTDEWKQNFATHKGEKNGRYIDISNEELIDIGKKLFLKHGKLTKKIWQNFAKENNLPQHLSNNFRFKSFDNFKNQVATNHKVEKVEFYGYEDVYNITVDDNHNYFIINSNKDDKFVTSSGICVKNCGEIPLSAFDSCRLLLLNLFGFVRNPYTPDAYFDYNEFYEYSKIAQRLMDDLIDLELEAIDKIINKIKTDPEEAFIKSRELNLWEEIKSACIKGRRSGTGITALGDTIAALNVKYGSDESISIVDKIYTTLKFGCYQSSCDMAKEVGSFPVFSFDLEKNNPFLKRFIEQSVELNNGQIIYGKDIYSSINKYGRRNIACMTTAPAGSVSIVAKLIEQFNSTSGIEPMYLCELYIRKKKGNPGDVNFRTDSVDQNGDHWMHFEVYPSGIKEWMKVTGNKDISQSPYYKACAVDLDWTKRVKLQAVAQKHVDHSISSTVNLPADVTVEKVKEIYEMAWSLGCKGITVYRDGCRSGVLTKKDESKKTKIIKTQAPKRPKLLSCDVHHATYKNCKYYVVVGLLDGEPYEVFTGINHDSEGDIVIPKSIKIGMIEKRSRGNYILLTSSGNDDSEPHEFKLTNGHTDDTADAMTRMISMGLRHGSDISFIVEQLEKTKGGLISFTKVLARTLKKYIKDGTILNEECPECGSELIRQSGCIQCNSCGYSKCS